MVKIITDSTCDMTHERLGELDIEALPLSVHFGDTIYADKVDLDNRTFYQMLRQAKTLPTTAQVNPAQLEAVFRRHIDNGDTVVGVFISSKLSGTYQSAVIAAEMVGSPDIHVVDSLTATLGLSLLLEQAARLRDGGASAEQLASQMEALAQRVTIYAVVDTLKYLKMGGRLSAASAVIGGLLNICPVITLGNGVVEAVGKGRGKGAAFHRMGELCREVGFDPAYGVSIGHADCPEVLPQLRAGLADFMGGAVIENEIGSVIGTHAGPGAAGVAFIAPQTAQ